MKNVTCHKCKTVFGIADDIWDLAHQRAGDMDIYCPNGHPGVFTPGESEEDKLRRERDRLKQNLAWKDDQIKALHRDKTYAERSLNATKGHLTRVRKRASHGVCLCCNRTFGDLARHMQTKHPTYLQEFKVEAAE